MGHVYNSVHTDTALLGAVLGLWDSKDNAYENTFSKLHFLMEKVPFTKYVFFEMEGL